MKIFEKFAKIVMLILSIIAIVSPKAGGVFKCLRHCKWPDYNGSEFGLQNDVNIGSVCIRPAFHFNLSTAAKTIGINLLTTPAHGVVVDVLMPTVFTVLTGFVVVYYVINSKKTKKLNKIC